MDKVYVGYARVSTREQKEDRQIIALTEYGVPKASIYTDKVSGKDFERKNYRRMIKKLASQGMSFLLSSHNMLEIEYVSDRVGIIAKGHLLETGTPAELKEKYQKQNLEEVFEKVVTSREIS